MLRRSSFAVTIALCISGGPMYAQSTDGWTGFYGGVHFGALNISGRNALDSADDGDSFSGLHAGYNQDFGDWVLGAEVDYDQSQVDLRLSDSRVGEVGSLSRFKLRAGYDLGQTMVYATAGGALADTDFGSQSGEFYGVGVAYEISSQFVVSGEILGHDFGDIGGNAGLDVDADTLSIRFALRF